MEKGWKEELYQQDKLYPKNQLIQRLTPKEYSEALILKTIRSLEGRFKELAESEKYDEMILLNKEVESVISKEFSTFKLPLSYITYNSEDTVPLLEQELFLSRADVLTNEKKSVKNFFKTLKFEMRTADRVEFMVSFTRMSGVQLLTKPLQELQKRGVPVRIITSTYLGITEPKALQHLLQFSNVEVKIIHTQKESFHTKAYLFGRDSGLNSVLIGSSNLSHSALINGRELNIRLPDTNHIPAYEKTTALFQSIWESDEAIQLTEDFIDTYSSWFKDQKQKGMVAEPTIATEEKTEFQPNAMQQEALKNLKNTRNLGNNKGVIIAATGTGKTYLAAFDVHQVQPKRLLFIAHREELLDNAIQTFEFVFNSTDLCGKLTGTKKEWNSQFVFSTIQTLSKDSTLQQFSPADFDYIIIDEFHHAEATTYKKVLDYFEPKFLLGLTATPERMDGRNVLSLCDHNIVYEVRLRQALEQQLLVPFHYFGIADETIDYSTIKTSNGFFVEDSLAEALNNEERVDFIINMMDMYGYHGTQLVCLGFCANVKHAKFMSESFNRKGLHTVYLTGKDSVEERQKMIARLENPADELQIIFTVNIFNEGIDIPKVNMMLFLRPTESSTVFIQQIGRGLRKYKGKEFVTILDFIGNYQKSFMIPLALAGQTNHQAFDRDALRLEVRHEFSDFPGGSYIDLDPVSQKELLDKIESIRMDTLAMLKALYQQFKNELGRSPELMDFLYSENAPSLKFFLNKYKTWLETKKKMNDLSVLEATWLEDLPLMQLMKDLEQKLPLKWPYEFLILKVAFEQGTASVQNVFSLAEKSFSKSISSAHKSLVLRSMERIKCGIVEGDTFILNDEIRSLFTDEEKYNYALERIDYGLIEFRRTFQSSSFFDNENKLVLYENYTRNDLIVLFEATQPEGSWREGVQRVNNHYLLFVNLNKAESVEDHLLYKDYFIDPSTFHWQSQNQTSHESKRGQDFQLHQEQDIHIHLFIRKFDQLHGVTLPFMYLGEANFVSSNGDKPMSIVWSLHNPLPEDLFMDFIR
ncbi:DUF3427 domain-containing protein [Domibacillus epiphyticus]|uniref:Restriction endonuclease subunit R n=1 Tax=Domibacillus epiphyticus TaxID=1714355 RepID=A0A1V2A6R4_9BACI|nr:DUF3427 domain-containing protein [Domibacillus epiphyticus]OMP66524.1 restriction endonuclease subunit R [Domibacillus epiphyticus]